MRVEWAHGGTPQPKGRDKMTTTNTTATNTTALQFVGGWPGHVTIEQVAGGFVGKIYRVGREFATTKVLSSEAAVIRAARNQANRN
jgi:hypothetical protein